MDELEEALLACYDDQVIRCPDADAECGVDHKVMSLLGGGDEEAEASIDFFSESDLVPWFISFFVSLIYGFEVRREKKATISPPLNHLSHHHLPSSSTSLIVEFRFR